MLMPSSSSLFEAHGSVLEPSSGRFFIISLMTPNVDVVAMYLPPWIQPLVARYIMFHLTDTLGSQVLFTQSFLPSLL